MQVSPPSPQSDNTVYTCEFCGVSLLDPISRSCDQCYYLLHNNDNSDKSTDVDEPENTGNVIGRGEGTGPQCESCGTCLLTPEAIICNYCNKPDRKKVLQRLLELSQPNTFPCTQPPIFGHDAKIIHKSLPGGAQQQQHTGAVTEHSGIGAHSVRKDVTFGESLLSIQRKRSGSESVPGQSLKLLKVDNENIPKNGQRGDQPAPMKDQQHQPVGTNEQQTQSPSVDIQIQRTEVYVKPKEPPNLLCPSSTTNNQLSSDQRKQSLPKCTKGMADPRYACVQYNIYALPWSYPPESCVV